jgi:hypothetical protein
VPKFVRESNDNLNRAGFSGIAFQFCGSSEGKRRAPPTTSAHPAKKGKLTGCANRIRRTESIAASLLSDSKMTQSGGSLCKGLCKNGDHLLDSEKSGAAARKSLYLCGFRGDQRNAKSAVKSQKSQS